MCWVMPPASPATTLAERILSSSVVLPWSTWPMIVMTGGRGCWFSSSSLSSNSDWSSISSCWPGSTSRISAPISSANSSICSSVERHRGRDHLAVVQQEAHDVGRGAVQLRAELLRRHTALDDDDALGHRRVAAGVVRELRLQLLAVATTTPAAAATRWATVLRWGAGHHRRDRRPVRHRDGTAGATGAATGTGTTGGEPAAGTRPTGTATGTPGYRCAGRWGPTCADRGQRDAGRTGGRCPGGGGIGRPDGDNGPAGGRRDRPAGRRHGAAPGGAAPRCRRSRPPVAGAAAGPRGAGAAARALGGLDGPAGGDLLDRRATRRDQVLAVRRTLRSALEVDAGGGPRCRGWRRGGGGGLRQRRGRSGAGAGRAAGAAGRSATGRLDARGAAGGRRPRERPRRRPAPGPRRHGAASTAGPRRSTAAGAGSAAAGAAPRPRAQPSTAPASVVGGGAAAGAGCRRRPRPLGSSVG